MHLAVAAALAFFATSVAMADAASGGISGVVRDARGTPIPFASVQIVRANGRFDDEIVLRADRRGFFTDVNLEAGLYAVSANTATSHACMVLRVYSDEDSRIDLPLAFPVSGPWDCFQRSSSKLVNPDQAADLYRIQK